MHGDFKLPVTHNRKLKEVGLNQQCSWRLQDKLTSTLTASSRTTQKDSTEEMPLGSPMTHKPKHTTRVCSSEEARRSPDNPRNTNTRSSWIISSKCVFNGLFWSSFSFCLFIVFCVPPPPPRQHLQRRQSTEARESAGKGWPTENVSFSSETVISYGRSRSICPGLPVTPTA